MKWIRKGAGWYEAIDDDLVVWRVAVEHILGGRRWGYDRGNKRVVLAEGEAMRPWLEGATTNRKARNPDWKPAKWVKPPLAYTHLTWVTRRDGVRIDWEGNQYSKSSERHYALRDLTLAEGKVLAEKYAASRAAVKITKTACPGCGKINTGRRASEVCDNCRVVLDGQVEAPSDQLWAARKEGLEKGKSILGLLATGGLSADDVAGIKMSSNRVGVHEKIRKALAERETDEQIKYLMQELHLANAVIEQLENN